MKKIISCAIVILWGLDLSLCSWCLQEHINCENQDIGMVYCVCKNNTKLKSGGGIHWDE